MSILQLNRIKKLLENQVIPHVDVAEIKSEKPNISEEELNNILFTRAYTLYALKAFTNESYLDLKKHITDGFSDNGIDAIYYSTTQRELILVQTKWIQNGIGGVDKGEVLKFLKGATDLLHLHFDKFNQKTQDLSSWIEEIILSSNVKIRLILNYSGNRISDENLELITDKLEEFNDTDEDVFFTDYNLAKSYSFLKDSIEGEPVNADIDLYNWGHTDEPIKSFYGTVSCGTIAELFNKNKTRLYSKNIRSFIGLSDINREIINTLTKNPETFYYLNNGITLLCKEINKSPYNSGKRDIGKFKLTDLTVVNGAQTVGSIGYAFKLMPEKVSNANVFIKIISLENTSADFDKTLTIASNTQNKIEKRDFISLDDQQKKLKHEFYLNGLKYHVKRDDQNPVKDNENYYFEESTIALACFQDDIDFSTYAKREIGRLWDSKPYNQLFNDKLTVDTLVKLVDLFRRIEKEVKKLPAMEKLICSHGVYLLSHLIVHKSDKSMFFDPSQDLKNYFKDFFKSDFDRYTKRLLKAYNYVSPNNNYPLSIFKNFNHCRKMKDHILDSEGIPKPGQTLNMFEEIE
ncbi:AIPR family protein [Aquiflexum gelatinilyticum]|uniref:AIPR family protein n=1 Tax=Aquiflexum gelatinilyticum TaxID=2961943 RepID=A0A9X2SXA5_9BACT|nr:AIPR family protein [Aquiflexum gelatinilyticum]MCR9013487.1 AIPR family protein [Aquiflexum gelatinilyticum]